MKIFLLLSVLTFTTLATGTSITTTTTTRYTGNCKDDGLPSGTRSDKCYCECTSDTSEVTCATQTELEAARSTMDAYKIDYTTKPTTEQVDMVSRFIEYCQIDNPALGGCRVKPTGDLGTTDTCNCPVCDETSVCTDYNRLSTPDYVCRTGECHAIICATSDTPDIHGNIRAIFSPDAAVVDSTTHCRINCTGVTDPIDPVDPEPDPCLSGDKTMVVGDDGCFRPCIDDGGHKRKGDATLDGASLTTQQTNIDTLRDAYGIRNPYLQYCPPFGILPNDEGCGYKCNDRCSDQERKGIIKRDDSTGLCRKIQCLDKDAVAQYTDDSGVTETYANIIKEFIEGAEYACDILFDQRDDDALKPIDSTGVQDVTICNNPCDYDRKEPICVTYNDVTTDTTIVKKFDCPTQAKCILEDKLIGAKVEAGRCPEPTDHECILGEIEVTDEYIPNAKCPRIRACVATVDGKRVMRPGTIRKVFPNLKAKCAERLDRTGCTPDRLYFDTCPNQDDSIEELCDKLLCDLDSDPNDVDGGKICRRSAERFEDTTVRERDDNGCNVKTCSATFDALESCTYDTNIDDCDRLFNVCPTLADCRTTQVDTGGRCGQCGTCLDDVDNDVRCARNTMGRGERACIEKPDDDETNPGDIAARVRFENIGFKMCLIDFGDFTRSDIYSFIKRAIYKICQECNIDVTDLREYIREFNFEVVTNIDDVTALCDLMIEIKATVDITDTNKERLIELIKCLKGFDLDVILGKIRDRLKDVTKGERLADPGDNDTEVTVESTDLPVTSSAAATLGSDINLYDADGNALVEYDTADFTTTEARNDNGNSCSGYVIVGGLMVSIVTMLF